MIRVIAYGEHVLGLLKLGADFAEFLALRVDVLDEELVLVLQVIVLLAGLRVELVQLVLRHLRTVIRGYNGARAYQFHLAELLLNRPDLLFLLLPLKEQLIQELPLLVVVHLDVVEQRADIIRAGAAALLVEGEVVVRELPLKVADLRGELVEFGVEGVVAGVFLLELADLELHVLDLDVDLLLLAADQVEVVVPVLNLLLPELALDADAIKPVLGDGARHDVHLRLRALEVEPLEAARGVA